MPAFVVAMLVVVYSQFIINDLPGAAPAGAFALVFAFLARGAPARKPLDSLKVKLIGTTELTLSAYHFGAILAGHAQAMQPFCALFMLVALALHVVIGDIEGCPRTRRTPVSRVSRAREQSCGPGQLRFIWLVAR